MTGRHTVVRECLSVRTRVFVERAARSWACIDGTLPPLVDGIPRAKELTSVRWGEKLRDQRWATDMRQLLSKMV